MITSEDIWHTSHNRVHNQLAKTVLEPKQYSCNLLAYIRGHGQMIVEAVEDSSDTYDPAFYLLLESVWYFEGPTHWQGADFYLGSIEEIKEIVSQGWINIEGVEDEFAQGHVLLKLERRNFKVRILAGSCYIESKSPHIHISYSDERS